MFTREKLKPSKRSEWVRIAAGIVALCALVSITSYLLGEGFMYVHPMLLTLYEKLGLSVLIDNIVLMTLCSLITFTRSFWARTVFLVMSPWYLIAATFPLLGFFTSIGLLTLPDVIGAVASVFFVAFVVLMIAEYSRAHVKMSPTLSRFLDNNYTQWRILTGLLLLGIGAFLAWLYLRDYVSAFFSNTINSYTPYDGPTALMALVPSVLLILIAVGLFMNKRWSLTFTAITLVILLLLYLVIIFAVTSVNVAMSGRVDDGGLYIVPLVFLPGLYILVTACMAFWYARKK